ncbi:hypothetical protein BDP27DRAFT_1371822 [Rhodocollybia butyracea]|uniref:Uncharacterized protein n=1 Tax=Rhodocollybia butyracea TaxID=206335 RepID=A0A9P5PBM8_9AGAR|nr:hypothetical protein BDP27DRAFT_1371822 [Rhodocollybia butyracea]
MPTRIRCDCEKCSDTADGYTFQIKKTQKIHQQKYPRKPLETLIADSNLPGPSNNARTPSPLPIPSSSQHQRSISPDIPPFDPIDFDLDNGPFFNDPIFNDNDMELPDQFLPFEPPPNIRRSPVRELSLPPEGDNPYQLPVPVPSPPPEDKIFQPITHLDNITPISYRNEEDIPSVVPPAFQEQSHVRMAYLNAVLANVYGCVPVLKATDQLNISLDMLEVAGMLPDEPRPVRSLPVAKARLGIDPDQWIVQYAICPQCWKHHHSTELRELERPECTVEGCSGIIYTKSTDSKGCTTRIPCKINPQVSLIESLHRMMQRPGFAESICDTRMKTCPSSNDDNFVMEDISDGSGWYTHTVETVQECGNRGTIRDVAADGRDEPKKLNDQRYGLNMTINCDWYVRDPGKTSLFGRHLFRYQ